MFVALGMQMVLPAHAFTQRTADIDRRHHSQLAENLPGAHSSSFLMQIHGRKAIELVHNIHVCSLASTFSSSVAHKHVSGQQLTQASRQTLYQDA